MQANMGKVDRIIRILIAAAIAMLYFSGEITGLVAIILGIFAAILLVTGLAGVCPGYMPFHISTRK
jgi:uncharacterized membrane protein required for colicin V production